MDGHVVVQDATKSAEDWRLQWAEEAPEDLKDLSIWQRLKLAFGYSIKVGNVVLSPGCVPTEMLLYQCETCGNIHKGYWRGLDYKMPCARAQLGRPELKLVASN